jgi:hypothetical protein
MLLSEWAPDDNLFVSTDCSQGQVDLRQTCGALTMLIVSLYTDICGQKLAARHSSLSCVVYDDDKNWKILWDFIIKIFVANFD